MTGGTRTTEGISHCDFLAFRSSKQDGFASRATVSESDSLLCPRPGKTSTTWRSLLSATSPARKSGAG